MQLSYFLQLLLNGTVAGLGYALIAIGWTILLGMARLVNFAHGTMYMLAAFVTWYLMQMQGFGHLPAILVACLVLAVLCIVIQHMMARQIQSQDLTSIMIITLGISYILTGAAGLFFGGTPQNIASPLRALRLTVGDVRLTGLDLAIIVVTLVIYAAVWLFLRRSRIGAAMRALAEDGKLAQLYGINPALLLGGIFAFEGASVALAAGLIAPRAPILTTMGFQEVILTFVIVVIGGIGSVPGALAAGLAIGIFISFFSALVSSAFALAAVFATLLVFLVARPAGFGKGI